MGPGTLEIPLELFDLNRKRVAEKIRTKCPIKSIILLQGGDEVPFYDTDTSYHVFRQVFLKRLKKSRFFFKFRPR